MMSTNCKGSPAAEGRRYEFSLHKGTPGTETGRYKEASTKTACRRGRALLAKTL